MHTNRVTEVVHPKQYFDIGRVPKTLMSKEPAPFNFLGGFLSEASQLFDSQQKHKTIYEIKEDTTQSNQTRKLYKINI